ncbi:ABC transporter substrate-binding protein [Mesobacillus foraminis]|uniref:Putative hydroxymethylpyrimidine transport system substrate-binding protein n=1 Tax=Mesobacillus foraminis TaxID=279826 RepID=A0A4R2BM73_9BACI|nr:ABC transporter substrate-binding protein [Mesobacillus foraminis]TCN27154.1 putative hydroxymethylpyrimidine transport system substrate-binding protein [Mesobacillus foraminis]
MKKWICSCLSILMIVMLAACGGKEANSAAQSGEKGLKEVSVMLDWYPNAVHSFLYVAEEKGYFKEEGIKVDIQFPANPTDPMNLAAAGKITLGFYYQPDVVMARANEDVPVKAVGAIVRSPLNTVIFPEDSTIKTPKDLEGKTVGYPGIPLNESLLKTMVSSDGGDYKKVNVVDVGFELGASVVSKQTDAVIGAFINHEVPVLKHQGHETRNLNPTDYGVPSYYELVAVTGDQTLEKEKEAIQSFWKVAAKGYEFMAEHPDEALQILMDNQDEANFPLDQEVEKESMEILLPKMHSEEGFGTQSKESWEETGKWLRDSGLIKEVPAVEDLFINLK